MREIKIRDYSCGLIVTIVGLGLYSYYVRELMAALTMFSVAFFLFGSGRAGRAPCLVRKRAVGDLGRACVAKYD